jgi:hypothetical protein
MDETSIEKSQNLEHSDKFERSVKMPTDLFRCHPYKLKDNIEMIGHVDVSEIKQFLDSQPPEVWVENTMRQTRFKVHRDTESILLKWTKKENSAFKDPVATSSLSDQVAPLLEPILAKIQEHYRYERPVIQKMMFAKLKAGGKILPHTDADVTLCLVHRIHIPIVTNKDVHFYVQGVDYHFEVGDIVELDNTRFHAVDNCSEVDRIHLIVDYYHE